MERTAASICSGAASPTRLAVQISPTPSALVRRSLSPGRPVSLAVRRCGSTRPVTDRPYFTPVSAMECPPASVPLASATFFGTAAQDLPQHVQIHALGEADKIQCRFDLTAHGVDIAQGIGRGNLPEGIGVIDHRREEIHRLHQGNVLGDAVDGSIVPAVVANQKVGVFFRPGAAFPECGSVPRHPAWRCIRRRCRRQWGLVLPFHARSLSSK